MRDIMEEDPIARNPNPGYPVPSNGRDLCGNPPATQSLECCANSRALEAASTAQPEPVEPASSAEPAVVQSHP